MSDEELESKQQYLRQEIIDKGYDPSDFNSYMCNIRQEENIDLNSWSIEELKSVVLNYQQSQTQKEEGFEELNYNNNNNNQTENDNMSKNNTFNDGRVSIMPQPKTEEAFDLYENTFNCIKLEENELTNRDDIRIVISDPVKINPGFFYASYFQYKVTTNPLNYTVIRKLSDFHFLNQKLPLIHPVIYTPLFPVFHYGVKDDSPKKLRYIQNYMNLILENKYFRSLPIVKDFLTLELDNWNIKMKNEYSKIKEPERFYSMPNFEGNYVIKITKEDDDKALNIKNEITDKNEGLKNLNYYLDELLVLMDKISLNLKNIGNSFFEMEKKEQKNNQNKILIKGYNNLGTLFQTWGNDYLTQKEFIKDEIKYYFKFISKEYKYFLKNFDNYKAARDEYKKTFDKVKKMKNPTQDNLIELKDIKKYYGFQLICVNDEYKKLESRMEKRLINQFTCYSQGKDTIFQDFNNCIKLVNFNEDNNDNKDDNENKELNKEEDYNENNENNVENNNNENMENNIENNNNYNNEENNINENNNADNTGQQY